MTTPRSRGLPAGSFVALHEPPNTVRGPQPDIILILTDNPGYGVALTTGC